MALLGRTAAGLFWMFRYIERAENMARIVDAGLRLSLTNLTSGPEEWQSVLVSAGAEAAFRRKHAEFDPQSVIDFLIRDRDNPSSIRSSIDTARSNGRMVRTALTREVWETLNEAYLALKVRLERPVPEHELPQVIDLVKRQTALIRGAFHGTMLRNEIFDFCNLGAFVERADNTARILDVKYWVLLPTHSSVGSPLDSLQWASILRSVSAQRSYIWEYDAEYRPIEVIDFLILNRRMPRSLAYSSACILESLGFLARSHGFDADCHRTAQALNERMTRRSVTEIIDAGLHEFLEQFIIDNNRLASEIAESFNFYK